MQLLRARSASVWVFGVSVLNALACMLKISPVNLHYLPWINGISVSVYENKTAMSLDKLTSSSSSSKPEIAVSNRTPAFSKAK